MKSLAALVLFALLVGAVVADEPPKKAAPNAAAIEVLRQLQGTWQVEAWEEGGKAVAEKELKTRGIFFGANVFILKRDDKPFRGGGIQFDPAKSPATMNFIV